MIKKTLVAIIFSILIPTQSFAITLGSSLGLSLGSIRMTSKENNVYGVAKEDSNVDAGFFYKYNWNIERIIVGVEFFYDYLNVTNEFANSTMDFRYRYGINANLGYNIFRNFSLYGIVGYGFVKYKAKNNGVNYMDKDNGMDGRPLYGVGVGYDLSVSWKFAIEYQYQEVKIRLTDGDTTNYKFSNRLETIKFAVIYKF